MIVNHNLLLYSKEYLNYTPLRIGGSWFRRYYTDYLIQTGEELIVADLSYSYYGNENYWISTLFCKQSEVGWNLGYFFKPVREGVREGGLQYYPDTKLTVEYNLNVGGDRILWMIDNTGLVGAYSTSGNWKKENFLGNNILEQPLDWTSLIGQPITIYYDKDVTSGSTVSYSFYGLRIYNNSRDRRLLAEYLPFDDSGSSSGPWGKLLNTVNGNIINYSLS